MSCSTLQAMVADDASRLLSMVLVVLPLLMIMLLLMLPLLMMMENTGRVRMLGQDWCRASQKPLYKSMKINKTANTGVTV